MSPSELFALIQRREGAAVVAALAAEPALAHARDRRLGSTPLHVAAHRGLTEVVAALLAAGAEANALETASGSTALHWAAEGGRVAMSRLLVEKGTDLESIDAWHGLSPLGWATVVTWAPAFHEDRPATVAYLREAGARLDVFTALVLGESGALAAMVANAPDVLTRRLGVLQGGMQPLHLAVARGRLDDVRLLLDLGADVAARTAWGLTPLAVGLRKGDAGVVSLLRSRGAGDDASSALVRGDLEALRAAGPERADLLFVAALEGRAPAIEALAEAGADPDARRPYVVAEVPARVTPLHLAASRGHAAAVRALLAAGAGASPGAEERVPTPLHLAAGSNHVEAVRALVAAGADVAATESGFGATPLGWAEFAGHRAVVELLRGR